VGPVSWRMPRVFVYTERTVDGMGKITTDKRAGFTLMELMVYIAIVGIVVIVAGQAFSNSTKMRVRTQSMLKASEVAENVAALFKQDVAQTGAKSSMEGGGAAGGDNFSAVKDSVYMDPYNTNDEKKDYSSFSVTTSDNFSDLKIRRVRYDENGYFVSVEEVNWFVTNGRLMRSCRTIDGTEDAEDCKRGTVAETKNRAVEIATGVSRFEVTPATPGVAGNQVAQMFPTCDAAGNCASEFQMIARVGSENAGTDDYREFRDFGIASTQDHKTVTLSTFSTNYNKNANEENAAGRLINQAFVVDNSAITSSSTWKNSCYRFTLQPQTEYEIMFSLADEMGITENKKARLFVPNRDLMTVGFRYASNGARPVEIEDFMFFPPADENAAGTRSMRFRVSQKLEKVCLAFSFASYSPIAAEGTVTISDLVLKKVESSNYSFGAVGDALNILDKKNVKAMRMVLNVERNGESGNDTLIVRVPSNGLPN